MSLWRFDKVGRHQTKDTPRGKAAGVKGLGVERLERLLGFIQPESHPFALPGLVKGSDLLTESLKMSWFIQSSWNLNSNSIEIRSEWCGWTLGTPPKLHAFNKPSILRLVHAVAATHRQIPAGRQDSSPNKLLCGKDSSLYQYLCFFFKRSHRIPPFGRDWSQTLFWIFCLDEFWAVPRATERAGFPEERWELWSGLTVRSPMVRLLAPSPMVLGTAMIQPWAHNETLRFMVAPRCISKCRIAHDCPVCFS
jgi:hypothetical protein